MSFKSLLDSWTNQEAPATTDKHYSVRLSVDDPARIHALIDPDPGLDAEHIFINLISTSLNELEAAIDQET